MGGASRQQPDAPFFLALFLDPGAAWQHSAAMNPSDILERLAATIAARRDGDPATSYVAQLNARGLHVIARKLGEEAVEAIVAALSGTREDLVGEAADVLFHLLMLLDAKDIPVAEVSAELARREGMSGIAEKAARGPA